MIHKNVLWCTSLAKPQIHSNDFWATAVLSLEKDIKDLNFFFLKIGSVWGKENNSDKHTPF